MTDHGFDPRVLHFIAQQAITEHVAREQPMEVVMRAAAQQYGVIVRPDATIEDHYYLFVTVPIAEVNRTFIDEFTRLVSRHDDGSGTPIPLDLVKAVEDVFDEEPE